MKLKVMLLALVFAAACKEDKVNASLEGKWALKSVSGGMVPVDTIKKYIEEHHPQIEIRNGEYRSYADGSLVFSSTYTLAKEDTVIDGYTYPYTLIFSENNRKWLKINGNNLQMQSASVTVDGAIEVYSKISD